MPASTEDHKGQTHYYRINFCPNCQIGARKRAEHERAIAQKEWESQARDQLRLASLDKGRYANFRFNTWDCHRPGSNAADAYKKVSQFVDHILSEDDGPRWLYLHGPNGNGKTHLAVAALRKIAIKRISPWRPRVIVWPELCQATKESWSADFGPSEAQLWGAARVARVLLIDDLDKSTTGEWAMEKLFVLINARSVAGRVTIITANRGLDELKRVWQRSKRPHVQDTGLAVLSRIADEVWGYVRFEGQDKRWVR